MRVGGVHEAVFVPADIYLDPRQTSRIAFATACPCQRVSNAALANEHKKLEKKIYIYIYAVKLLSGPSFAISGVIIWAK